MNWTRLTPSPARLALALLALCVATGAMAGGNKRIVIAEQPFVAGKRIPSAFAAPMATALCALYRESLELRVECDAEAIPPGDESWPRRLRDSNTHIAIVGPDALDGAIARQSRETPLKRGLRLLFPVGDERVLVSSTAVSTDTIGTAVGLVMDNLLRLQSLYIDAARLDQTLRDDWIVEPLRRKLPLHTGAWAQFIKRDWLQKPFWPILGSFRDRAEAERVAGALATRYGKAFSKGLQVRFANNDFYALIGGPAMSGREAGALIERLQRQIKAIPKDAYSFPALRGWGPDLLY